MTARPGNGRAVCQRPSPGVEMRDRAAAEDHEVLGFEVELVAADRPDSEHAAQLPRAGPQRARAVATCGYCASGGGAPAPGWLGLVPVMANPDRCRGR